MSQIVGCFISDSSAVIVLNKLNYAQFKTYSRGLFAIKMSSINACLLRGCRHELNAPKSLQNTI